MTTISPNRRRTRVSLRTLVFSVLFVVVFGSIFFARAPIAGVLWQVLAPILAARDSMVALVGVASGQFTSNTTLQKENEQLRATVASISIQMLDYDVLLSENTEFKKQFSVVEANTVRVAGVLARPPGLPYDTLMIDVGSKDGIIQGAEVSAGGRSVIGFVDQVYSTTARVVLYSAPGQTHEVVVIPSNPTAHAVPISVMGQGAGSFFGEVPAGTDLSVGDISIFPGISEKMMARVSAIDAPGDASFKKVYLQFPINIFSLRFVEVLLPPNHEKK